MSNLVVIGFDKEHKAFQMRAERVSRQLLIVNHYG